MGNLSRIRSLALAAVAVAGVIVPAHAQDADDQQRGVARISLMNGEVSVRRGDAGEWVAGVINAPLMSDDRISTAPNSRAEVQFDASNVMRIGGNAEVHLAQVSDGRYQLEVAHGTVTFVVLRPSSANVEVDTPSVSVRPNQRGVYRIAVNEAGETQVICRSGQVEVFTPRGSEWVGGGRMMIARGDPSNPEFQIVNGPPFDDWDRWNQDRDQRMLQTSSYQYVPQGVYGAEDLDQYGTWTNVEPYGYVWRPTVVVDDWAPYRSGRWVWEDWYGWTWVSYDPWGWAPYHYGRWFHEPGWGWCWYPGLLGRHHYWSPALVAWFGWGHGGVGFGFGNIGWVPLAPYETFHPWWGRGYYGHGFNERINITNINITNVYRNSRIGGISGMGYNDFQSGRFHGISRFSGDQVREAGLIRGQMPVAPGRSHLQFSDRAAAFTPRESGQTRFFSQQRPAQVQRVPFEQQRSAFTRGNTQMGGSLAQAPQRGGGPALDNTRPPSAQRGGGGWRSFGDPGRGSTPPDVARPNRAFENARPQNTTPNPGVGGQRFGRSEAQTGSQPMDRSQRGGGGWRSFGEPGVGGNTRPPAASQRQPYQDGSSYSAPRYGAPGGVTRERPSYSAPSQSPRYGERPSYSAPSQSPRYGERPSYSAPSQSPRYGERPSYSAPSQSPRYGERPSYSAPSQGQRYGERPNFGSRGYGAPSGGYSAPQRSAPSFSAPPRQSMPSYSAPSRPSGGGFGGGSPRGGGGFSAPSRPSGGGGGFSAPRSSGGGGGGGGGGSRPSSGGGGRGRR